MDSLGDYCRRLWPICRRHMQDLPHRANRLAHRSARQVMELARHPRGQRALLYGLLIFLLCLYFVLTRELAPAAASLMLLAAWPLGGLFGLTVLLFDRRLQPAVQRLRLRVPGTAAHFLLFFVYLIGYVLVFAGLVSYPLGLIIDEGVVAPTPATDFRIYSMNFVLFLALWSWLDGRRRFGAPLSARLEPWRRKLWNKETP